MIAGKKVNVPAAGFLLAGGRSSRMGQDKALLAWHGEPLVKQGIRKLSQVCAEVAIAGGAEELTRFARLIPDKNPGCGPLGGIVSALEQSSFQWNLFLPVDAPFVPIEALSALLSLAESQPGVCAMARAQGRMQPLCAAYSKDALERLQRELADGRWKVLPAIEAAGVVNVMNFEDVRWFANLNTPEEFEAAERFAKAGDGIKPNEVHSDG